MNRIPSKPIGSYAQGRMYDRNQRPKDVLIKSVKKVINANRLTRLNALNDRLAKLPSVRMTIDERVEGASKQNGWNVYDAILSNLTQHYERDGKFKNLKQALELLNETGGINNFGEYIKNKNEANEFFMSVIKNKNSNSDLSATASQMTQLDGDSILYFKSPITGKEYTNEPDFGFFEYLYKFSIGKNKEKCYIIYEQRDDKTIYIDMIRCEPNESDEIANTTVKGSGRVIILDLFNFLLDKPFGRGYKYNINTIVCLTPEHAAGRDEHLEEKTPADLNNYYSDMGFDETLDWCATIGDVMPNIFRHISQAKVPGLVNESSPTSVYDDGFGGGRKKRTTNKRTKRKTKKSKKTRKRRN